MNGTIGAQLKQAREQRHLTLQQASEATKVRPHYLQALENDDLSELPSTAQARGFLRLYAQFLGMKVDELSASVASPESAAPMGAAPATPASEHAAANSSDVPTITSPRQAPQTIPAGTGLLAALWARLARRPKAARDAVPTEAASSEGQPPDTQSGTSLPPVILPASGASLPEATLPPVNSDVLKKKASK